MEETTQTITLGPIRLEQRDGGWTISQWPQVQAAFVAVEPGSGRVRALQCSW